MPFFSIVKEKLDAKARAAQQEEQGEEGEEGETAATVARVEQQDGEASTGGQQNDGQGEVAADDAAGATTEQIQAASEAETSSDASAKRQKKGKGRMTAKRRQKKDEKEKKISAKKEFAVATKASSAAVQNPCPRCKSAAARLDDEATALIEGHADPVAAQDDPEVERLRAEAKARLELAYTHARPTNQLCPDYIKRKSVKTKERLGKTRQTTIKHGLASLLSNDIADDDQHIILDGIHNIVTFNRHLAINAILFTQKYVVDILHSGGHVPRALFTQAFFIAVFQLILGNPVSNKALFADNDTRTAFLQAFDQFKIEHPQIHMNKLVGVNGKPNGFANVTDYTAIQLATMMKNHVVENFEIFFMRYLAAKFAKDHPDLKPHHCRSYAMYAYDKVCKDELFPPELPDYKKMKAEQKEQLKNDADDLAQHAEGKLARVGDFVVEEKAQIAESSRKRQEANDRARDMSLANRNAIIAALTFSSPAPQAPPAPEMVAAESSASAQAAAAAAQEAAIAAQEIAIAAQEAAIAEAAALQAAALQSARDRAAELHAAAAEAQVAAMAQAQETEFDGNVAATMHVGARNALLAYNACTHAANAHHSAVIPPLAEAASIARAALEQAPAAMAAIAQESFRQADQAYRGALDYSAVLVATVENARRGADVSHQLAQQAAQKHATSIALSTAKNADAEAAAADASAADAQVASIMAAMAAANDDDNDNGDDDDDDGHPMEIEPLDDDDVSMMHASDAMSTSTVGAAAMAQLHVSHNASVTTATLTKYPHFFIKVLYDALKEMEAWNDDNAARPAQVATEATFPWTKHQLEEKVPAWERLNYRRRSRLTRIITKIINGKDNSLDIARLPYQKQLDDQESQDAIKDIVTETKHKIKNNTFMPEIYIARPAIRLFSVVPSLSFRLRYIHWSHMSLLRLLAFLGLTKYKQGTESAPDDGSVHPIFDRLFNWTKIRKPKQAVFDNALATDGLALSLYYRIPITGKAPPQLTLADIEPEDLQHCHVWGVDPGVNEVFVAVDGSSQDDNIYGPTHPTLPPRPPSVRHRVRSASVRPLKHDAASNQARSPSIPRHQSHRHVEKGQRHQVRRFSAHEFDHVAGIKRSNAKIKTWKANDIDQEGSTIANLESQLASAKTSMPSRMAQHVESVLAAMPRLMAHYALAHQGLRFLNYQGRQRATEEMVRILCHGGGKYQPKDTTGPPPRDQDGASRQTASMVDQDLKWRKAPNRRLFGKCPLICIGDAQFRRMNWRGKPSGRPALLRRALALAQRACRLLVVQVPEPYSSKTCSSCGRRSLTNVTKRDSGVDNFKLHGALTCTWCARIWQRDVNAARNIRAIALMNINGRNLPALDPDNKDSRPAVFTKAYDEPDPQQPPFHWLPKKQTMIA